MYAQLGNIIFDGRKGFDSLVTTREANYAEHALIEGKPKLQLVGKELDEIQIKALFDASFCNPQRELNALDSFREAGVILPLIMGDGTFVGTFVITSLSTTQTESSRDGRILQAEVTIDLLEYYIADAGLQQQDDAITSAQANPDNNPQTFVPEVLAVSEASQAIASVVGANASAETGAALMEALPTVPSLYRTNTERIVQNMVRAGDQLNEVLQIINAQPGSEIWDLTRQLAVKVEELSILSNNVKIEADDLLDAIDSGNASGIASGIVSVSDESTEVTRLTGEVRAAASDLTAYTVTQ